MKSNYYPGLTSIRAIAALMVYLHHFNPFYNNQTFLGFPVWGVVKEFHIGVTIFFVLSGFLITLRYFEKPIDFKHFLWNRITRIYPVYFLISSIAFIYEALQSGFTLSLLKVFFLNITFLRGFIDSMKFTLVAQGWSLTVEELFYIVSPLIFFYFTKYGKKTLIVLPIIFVFTGILISKFSFFFGWEFWGDFNFTFNYTFFGRSFEFIYGVFLAIVLKENKAKKLKIFANPYIGIFLAIFSAFLLFEISQICNVMFGTMTFLGILLNTVFIPIMVMTPLLLSFTVNKNKFKILESKSLEIFGKASYTFYLIHIGVFRLLLEYIGLKNELYILLALILISILIWRFFEEPSQKALKSLITNNELNDYN